jgi:hypothetical protein
MTWPWRRLNSAPGWPPRCGRETTRRVGETESVPRAGLALDRAGLAAIVTGIAPLCVFHRAGECHQGYRKNRPVGKYGLRPRGMAHPLRAGR